MMNTKQNRNPQLLALSQLVALGYDAVVPPRQLPMLHLKHEQTPRLLFDQLLLRIAVRVHLERL